MAGLYSQATFLVILLFCAISNVKSYSKYGRKCQDIGCLPNEVCIMAYDSCSYSQRENTDCGQYPTCKRNSDSRKVSAGASLNPAPENTHFSRSSNPSRDSNTMNNQNPPTPINPNYVFGAPQNPAVFPNNFPIFPHHQPTAPPPFQQFPQANHPNYPQFPQNVPPQQPQNPYNPGFVFGRQPNLFYGSPTTTKEPSLFHQFLYNKQDRKKNSSSKLLPGFITLVLCFISNFLIST